MSDASDASDASGTGEGAMPDDPFSPILGVGIEMFTVYTGFMEAGFTSAQALELVKVALQTHMQMNMVIALQKRRDEGGL